MREMVGGCCVCSDDRGWSENPLVYCDGQSCNVAVHQACYGIVTVPTGPWYCCKCESQERSTKVKCELCPSKYGALKRTDNQGWAHVVCALYIPEVRFGNVSTMEPIQLQLIPQERFNKACYICEEKGKATNATVGACMQCNKAGCKQQFHVTCAQSLGLLCEEAGNYLDNVKYCGYCQHHYSKLKKGGNVKTIPPYKPVSEHHNSDSNSEREAEEGALLKRSSSPLPSKRKSSSSSKSSSSKVSNSSSKSSGSQQKTGHNSSKGSSDKKISSSKSAKSDESASAAASTLSTDKIDKKDSKSDHTTESDRDSKDKDSKSYKKRKVNSRTPTPVQSEISVVVSVAPLTNITASLSAQTTASAAISLQSDKNSVGSSESSIEKSKKVKVETTQSIISNQPVVALTSISTLKSTATTAITSPEPIVAAPEVVPPSAVATSSIIHTAQAQAQQHQQSLVVSVPLASTTLSPHHPIVSNQTSVLATTPFPVSTEKNSAGSGSASERVTPVASVATDNMIITSNSNQGILTSEMSGGGLKITYEKQPDSINTEVDMEIEMETPPSNTQEMPAKRARSQSHEKTDRTTRGKKRNSTGSNGISQIQTTSFMTDTSSKRSSRSQAPTPSGTPPQQQPGAFAVISQEKIKDSPPSSPSSESQGASSSGHSRTRAKGRKSAPAAVGLSSHSSMKEDKKEFKLFQNGVTTAPHMLGNQLNPTSNMHQKMNDHLNSELEAHSVYSNSNDTSPTLIGPQMHHKVVSSVRASSTGSSTASGGSGLSSVLGGGGGTIPQTLDQLLERQWEQGSQFLMEQAQHFDIASLLSCLHQLRAENLRLEEHVSTLIQRRDHLLAVNARLAIPLTGQPTVSQPPPPTHPHTVNNIHPSVTMNHADMSRSSRHSSGSGYERHMSNTHHPPVENGLPPESYGQNPHRSPVGTGQPSPTVRHSPAGAYSNNGLLRQCADTGGRAAPPRPQPYPLYDRPGSSHSSTSQQMVIRRDRDRDPDIYTYSSKPG
ncbi:hypothetical protein GWI33_012333 [Rhynchophorus ferrugineus]|uniref:Protein AF-10 n=1 Tax=Rhynchophorus ferrugineus TaxID=354439 RepID=A0A834IRF7_RHYFE|nr:hypothetical protein GWI33_012333 [Rhynchophorus ferrugineus]